MIKVTVVKNPFCPNLLVSPRRPGAGILFYNKEESKKKADYRGHSKHTPHKPFQKCMPKNFLWGPVGKKNYRAALRRHGNFVFPATPQVFYWAYISAFTHLYVAHSPQKALAPVAVSVVK